MAALRPFQGGICGGGGGEKVKKIMKEPVKNLDNNLE